MVEERHIIDVLKTRVEKKRLGDYTRVKEIESAVKEWRTLIAPMRDSDEVPIKPQRLIKEIREYMGKDDLIVCDASYSGHWVGAHYDVCAPGRTILYPRGFGTLGWGFPAAIGARLAAPDKKVLCITGDGAFGYHLGKLETALRVDAPVVTLVLNNTSLAFEKDFIKHFYERKYAGVDFSEVRFDKIAGAFGCKGVRVERSGEIRDAITEAFRSGKPAVIDAIIDPNILPPVRWFSKEVRSH